MITPTTSGPLQPAGRPRPRLALAALLAAGCSGPTVPPAAGAPGQRLEIVESVGAPTTRAVTLGLTLRGGSSARQTEVDAVRVRLRPAAASSTSKLEALLGDVTLTQRQDGWPVSARAVPAGAEPAMGRLELAAAGLNPELQGTFLRSSASFDGGQLSAGVTRVELSADQMAVYTLGLASVDGGTSFAWGSVHGPRSAHAIELTGSRSRTGSETEAIRLTARQLPDSEGPAEGTLSGAPAATR